MSKYTTEVRYICETACGLTESVGGSEVEEVIANSLEKIFDFDFPIFDENYRKVLETKIIRHFYTREIGFETVGLWKLKLNTKLNEIMPYYNKLYNSELIEIDPLRTVNKTIKREGSGTNVSSGADTTTNDGWTKADGINKFSDTPQGSIQNLKEDRYLTNATINDDSGSYHNTTVDGKGTTITTTNDYIDTIVGYESRDVSDLLIKFRKTFLNIDMQIINELDSLFMQLW